MVSGWALTRAVSLMRRSSRSSALTVDPEDSKPLMSWVPVWNTCCQFVVDPNSCERLQQNREVQPLVTQAVGRCPAKPAARQANANSPSQVPSTSALAAPPACQRGTARSACNRDATTQHGSARCAGRSVEGRQQRLVHWICVSMQMTRCHAGDPKACARGPGWPHAASTAGHNGVQAAER
jgi:hypothetical protein